MEGKNENETENNQRVSGQVAEYRQTAHMHTAVHTTSQVH